MIEYLILNLKSRKLLLQLFLLTLALGVWSTVNGQQTFYDVSPGNGKGLRFWSSDNYKIHMGNASENQYSPVTDFSIKFNMSDSPARGWTWGVAGSTPVAALNTQGIFRLNYGLGIGRLKPSDISDFGLWINKGMAPTGGSGTGNFTSIQLIEKDWSGSHALLFGAYATNNQINGNLSVTGNTKYTNNVGSYTNGAGAIMYFGNEGVMDFFISPTSTGKGTDVNWGTPKLRIKRDGFVGIGTANPTQKLTLMDGQMLFGSTTTNQKESGRIRFSEHVSSYQGSYIHYDGTSNILNLGVHNSNDTNANSDEDVISIVRASGNVGIGTADPTQKLSVNGTIRSKEIICEVAPWPDYVFEEGYDLKSLSEIETFIKEEGHLPNIPSAEEVQTEGVALAEMNALLLEKIEELTLHVIQLNADKQDLNKELKQMQDNYSDLSTRIQALEE